MASGGQGRGHRLLHEALAVVVSALLAVSAGVAPAPATTPAAASTDVLAFGSAAGHGGTTDADLTAPVVGMAATPTGGGYWEVTADGSVHAFGDARPHGSLAGATSGSPVVGIAATPTGRGYWLAAADGRVAAFGDAVAAGPPGPLALNRPVVAIAATPTGRGYWLTAGDGGIFAFGDATFAGSTGAMRLNRPVVGMASTPSGRGYWLVASDGGIFSFGDARFAGSTGAMTLNRPVVGMAATPSGRGYWLVASDGGIFSFGDAPFRGSAAGRDLGERAVVGMAGAPDGRGYWLVLGRRRELPRGGRTLFPDWRVVAHYGGPQSPRLGVLGTASPEEAARRVLDQAAAYERFGRPVLPAFELISVIATAAPGDGSYSTALSADQVQRHLDVARANGMLLILDIQPGRASFLDEARRFERFLREPDVGLALDPEWSVRAPQTPGRGHIGSTDAAAVNEVSAWLAGLVAEEGLPEKLLVVHQFTAGMVRDRHLVVDRPGLAVTFHVDGFGGQAAKRSKYAALRAAPPFATGFKLFYDLDVGLLPPEAVMALSPPPDLVTYQ